MLKHSSDKATPSARRLTAHARRYVAAARAPRHGAGNTLEPRGRPSKRRAARSQARGPSSLSPMGMSMAIPTSPVSARANSGARSATTEKEIVDHAGSAAATTQPPRQPSMPTNKNPARGLRAAVVRELQGDREIFFLDERDDLLEIVAILAGHAN